MSSRWSTWTYQQNNATTELYVVAVVDLNISTEQCYNRIVCRGGGRPEHINRTMLQQNCMSWWWSTWTYQQNNATTELYVVVVVDLNISTEQCYHRIGMSWWWSTWTYQQNNATTELYVVVVDWNISTEQCYNRIVCHGGGRPEHINRTMLQQNCMSWWWSTWTYQQNNATIELYVVVVVDLNISTEQCYNRIVCRGGRLEHINRTMLQQNCMSWWWSTWTYQQNNATTELYVVVVVDLNISTEQCYNRIVCRGGGRPEHINRTMLQQNCMSWWWSTWTYQEVDLMFNTLISVV